MQDSQSGGNKTSSQLLARLVQVQRDRGWHDGQMAAWLGVERSYWNRVRRGVYPLSGKAINMALARDTRSLGLLRAHRLDLGLLEQSA